ncbi:MAG: carbohydrate-binding protein [Patescibacteria group bacterium]
MNTFEQRDHKKDQGFTHVLLAVVVLAVVGGFLYYFNGTVSDYSYKISSLLKQTKESDSSENASVLASMSSGVGSNPCSEGSYLDLSSSPNVCRKLKFPERGFKWDQFNAAVGNKVYSLDTCTYSALQSLLDSLGSDGGTVNLPACTITITAKLELPNNIILQGAGVGKTILKRSGYTNDVVRFKHKKNLILRDLTVDGSSTKGLLINIWYSDNALVERVEAKNSDGDSAIHFRYAKNITVRYNEAHNASHGVGSKDCSITDGADNNGCLNQALNNSDTGNLLPGQLYTESYSIYSNDLHDLTGLGVDSHANVGETAGNYIYRTDGSKFPDATNVYVHHNKLEDNIGTYATRTYRIYHSPKNVTWCQNKFINSVGSAAKPVVRVDENSTEVYLLNNSYEDNVSIDDIITSSPVAICNGSQEENLTVSGPALVTAPASLCSFCMEDSTSPPPDPAPSCGDGVCSSTESCSLCSADCGQCPSPPPPSGDTMLLEAEDAVFGDTSLGTSQVDTVHSGYSGTGFVDLSDFPNGADGFIEWKFNVIDEGKYALDFGYALSNGISGDRPMDLIVNGKNLGAISFTSTGSWTTWKELGAEVDLPAGEVTVRLVAAGTYGGPNVDYLKVTTVSIMPPDPPAPSCGDNQCNGNETCSTCSADCGACPVPPPPPPPSGGSNKLEAENANFGDAIGLGTTKVATNHAGYSGDGFVDMSNSPNGKGGYVEWTYNSSTAGTYSVDVIYALSRNSRNMDLIVNGNVVENVAYTSTGSWETWGTVTKSISLTSGLNTIRVEATDLIGGPNVDYLTLNPLTSTSNKYEAEEAAFGDNAGGGTTNVASNQAGYSGNGFIDYSDYPDGKGSYVEWTVSAPTAGDYLLSFGYALDSDSSWMGPNNGRPLDLIINGVILENINFTGTGSTWEDWGTLERMVSLNNGFNTVRLSATHSVGGPNMDYLEVTNSAFANSSNSVDFSTNTNDTPSVFDPISQNTDNVDTVTTNPTVPEQPIETPQPASSTNTSTATATSIVFGTSFETDPTKDFSTSGRSATFSWANDQSYTGNYSLKTTVTDSRYYGSWTSIRKYIPVEQNQTYALSMWLKGQEITNGAVLTMSYYGGLSGSTYLGRFETTVSSAQLKQPWVKALVEGKAPTDATYMRVSLSLNGSGTLWADGLEVTQVSF